MSLRSRVIEAEENRRRTPIAVSGFDLTFTVPKSVSVLWALADPATQTRIANAHRDAVNQCLQLIEAHALFTRDRQPAVSRRSRSGVRIAAGFDHWDTRTGDPNLHTHLVIANKVQGLDGGWRSIDAKALYAATVAVSEIYDCLIADAVARDDRRHLVACGTAVRDARRGSRSTASTTCCWPSSPPAPPKSRPRCASCSTSSGPRKAAPRADRR